MAGQAVIAGGGLAGLAAAIRLRAAGREVLLLERGQRPGGKCNLLERDGFRFDTGPSLLTMPFVLEELFQVAGRKAGDYLSLQRLDPACRYHFSDGLRFDAPGTEEGWEAAVKAHFPEDWEAWRRYMRECRALWEVSGPAFLFQPMSWRLPGRIRWKAAWQACSLLWPRPMDAVLRQRFRNPHLIQLLRRYATFNGSDPRRAPATFLVIGFVEAAYGAWHCRGGMYAVVEGLVRLAQELGVEMRTHCGVRRLRFAADPTRVTGVTLETGETIATETVVVNVDAVAAMTGELLSEHPDAARWRRHYESREASVSGYVVLGAVDRTVEGLGCHNIFFCDDYDREFAEIFERAAPLSAPTLYLHIPSKVDTGLAPPGKENWFVLVNAPSLDRHGEWPGDYGDRVVEKLEQAMRRHGNSFSGDWLEWREYRSPRFFSEAYGAWHGSLYGLSSNTLRTAFWRAPNRTKTKGLYFAGGSAHPGGGIPLVLLSGRMAAEAVLREPGNGRRMEPTS